MGHKYDIYSTWNGLHIACESDGGYRVSYTDGMGERVRFYLAYDEARGLSDYFNETLLGSGEYQELVPTEQHDLPE